MITHLGMVRLHSRIYYASKRGIRNFERTARLRSLVNKTSCGVMGVIVKDEICVSDVPGKRDYIQ